MFSVGLILELADQVESSNRDGQVWALCLSDLPPADRQTLIDTHGQVLRELRLRDRRVRAARITNEEGELLTLRLVPADWFAAVP